MSKNKLENFKNATAATLRALAGKKNFDVNFLANERLDRPTKSHEDHTTLPLPPQSEEEDWKRRGAVPLMQKPYACLTIIPAIHQQNAPADLTAQARL